MQSKVENIIRTLESKYKNASEKEPEYMHSASGSIKYKLHKFSEENFNTYSPFGADKHFRVAAFDGGSLLIYETPSWNIAYIKLGFRSFEVDLKDKTCNTVQKDRVLEHDLLMLTEKASGIMSNSTDSVGRQASGGNTKYQLKKDFDSGSILKQMETDFILKQIENGKVEQDDLLLIDGALGPESMKILNRHKNVVAVSKRTGHCINNCSAASFMALKARKHKVEDNSWFYYPLVQEYEREQEPVSELIFGTFQGNSNVFRIDFPYKQVHNASDQKKFIKERMNKLSICALDSKYKAYPYPLGAVHSDAVMRKNTQDQIKLFIKKHINELKKKSASEVFEMLEKDIQHADWYDQLRKGA